MKRLLDLFFPRRCPDCGKPVPFGAAGCDCHTLQTRRVDAPVCEHCGAGLDCCTCAREDGLLLPHIAAPFYYTGTVRDDLLELKFSGVRSLAGKLGREMAQCFADVQPDVVTAVPMSKESARRRGFNQSVLLAKVVASQLRLPCAALLQKTRETETQHTLSEKARRENLREAFALLPNTDVRGKTVLLVDDIKTTGATLYECVKVLQESGAAAVYCLCCAVTVFVDDV